MLLYPGHQDLQGLALPHPAGALSLLPHEPQLPNGDRPICRVVFRACLPSQIASCLALVSVNTHLKGKSDALFPASPMLKCIPN